MKMLILESTPGLAAPIEQRCRTEGHTVISCTDEHGGPCRGVADLVECPLERHVDLTVLARTSGSPRTLAEMGAVCAARHRVPLVEVDPAMLDDELPSLDVATALATRAVEAGYATAVRHELADIPALVHVTRTDGRVHVRVDVPVELGTPQQVAAIADRARHATRTHDAFVRNIDVSVSCYPSPSDDQL